MPHFIVEYASPLAIKLRCRSCNKPSGKGLRPVDYLPARTSIRLLPYQCYQVGTESTDFIHVTARILTGRSAEQRQQLAAMLLAALVELALSDVSLTVEVVEIERQSYAKQLV